VSPRRRLRRTVQSEGLAVLLLLPGHVIGDRRAALLPAPRARPEDRRDAHHHAHADRPLPREPPRHLDQPFLPQRLAAPPGKLTLAVPAGAGNPPLARISLTLRALLDARAIFLLIAGEAKRQVIARAQAGEDLPVRALLAQDKVPVRVLWAPSH
jgi:hypothetical protein